MANKSPASELRKAAIAAVGTDELLRIIALLLVELVAWEEAAE